MALFILIRRILLVRLLTILLCCVVLRIMRLEILILMSGLLIERYDLNLEIPISRTRTAVSRALLMGITRCISGNAETNLIRNRNDTIPITTNARLTRLLRSSTTILIDPIPDVLRRLVTDRVDLLSALLDRTIGRLDLNDSADIINA